MQLGVAAPATREGPQGYILCTLSYGLIVLVLLFSDLKTTNGILKSDDLLHVTGVHFIPVIIRSLNKFVIVIIIRIVFIVVGGEVYVLSAPSKWSQNGETIQNKCRLNERSLNEKKMQTFNIATHCIELETQNADV